MPTELEITKLAYGGEGIGHLMGKVCFVEGALPGETVLAEILADKKSFMRAKTTEILKASEHRRTPPCPYVEECAGCQYQHLDYREELRWKEMQVREYFEKNLGVAPETVKPIAASPQEYASRNSISLHQAWNPEAKKMMAGFVAKDNESILVIDRCLLAADGLSGIFQQALPDKAPAREVTFRLSLEGNPVSDDEKKLFQIKVGSEILWSHSKSFFQNNLAVTAEAGRLIKAWTEALKPDYFLDLYSGVGTFSLLAAGQSKIVCIEENPFSLSALRRNFQERDLQAEIIEGQVEKTFHRAVRRCGNAQVMAFLDPPRTGLEGSLAKDLASGRLQSIVYLSCHMGSLTRDLKEIMSKKHYVLREVRPLDMFPKTKHIETLVLLTQTRD